MIFGKKMSVNRSKLFKQQKKGSEYFFAENLLKGGNFMSGKKKLTKSQKIKRAKRLRKARANKSTFGSDKASFKAKEILNNFSRIGKSKRQDRQTGIEGINSESLMNKTQGIIHQFTRFVREKYGIKYLNMFRQEHAIAYLKYKEEQGLQYGSLQNIESALINLDKAMKNDEVFRVVPFVMPDKRIYPTQPLHERIKRVDRSYSKEDAESILRGLEESGRYKLADGVFLALNAGLRAEEVCLIESRHFIYDENKKRYNIYIPANDKSYVTKGNRFRKLWIDSRHTERIDRMLEGLEPNEPLIGEKPTTFSGNVYRFITNELKMEVSEHVETMHGFRHRFARDRFQEYLPQTQEHQEMFNRMLDNMFAGQRADAGVLKEETKIYNEVKKALDQTHSDLGHGEGRWDLAMTYLC